MKNIVLFGASGFTGHLIAKKLLENDIRFIPAVRNPDSFTKLFPDFSGKILKTNIENETSLKEAVYQADIFVNCVGPFNIFGEKVLKIVAKKTNLVYLDISGEQDFILKSYKKISDIASKNRTTIIHSFAYESALADLLANTFLEKNKNYNEINSFYFSKNSVLSGGSRFTMRLHSFFDTFAFINNKFTQLRPYQITKKIQKNYLDIVNTAYFVPYPEVIFFAKNFNVKNVLSFHIFDTIFNYISKDNSQKINDIITKEQNRKRMYIKEKFLEREKFYLLISAIDTNNETTEILAEGINTYGLTADLQVNLIKFLLAQNIDKTGVVNPASIVNSYEFLQNFDIKIIKTTE